MANSKISYGKAEIIEELETGIRLVKFNNRFYTTYGRLFAVKGNQVNTPYDEVNTMKHYEFCNWNTLENMYANE